VRTLRGLTRSFPLLWGLALLSVAPPVAAQTRAYVSDLTGRLLVVDTDANTVLASLPMSGPRGLAVDPEGTRVYAASPSTNQVHVIETSTNTLITSFQPNNGAGGPAPLHLALNSDGSRLYVSNNDFLPGGSVSVIDPGTTGIVGTILVGSRPSGVAISPASDRLYVSTSDGLYIVDTATLGTIATVAEPVVFPREIVFTPDGARAYVTSWNSSGFPSTVWIIDVATSTRTGTVVLPGISNSPQGLAITPDGTRVYVAHNDAVAVIDTATNAITANIPMPSHFNSGVAITAEGDRAYAAGGGLLSVISVQTNAVLETVALGGVLFAVAMATLDEDATPPVITPDISGVLGENGWYRGPVTVAWSVEDPESGVASSVGCGTTTLTADTAGTVLTCTATNGAGLTASESVEIRIDTSPPTLACSVTPSVLWPPNHAMRAILAAVQNADPLSGAAGFVLSAVASSEAGGEEDIAGFEIGTADVAGELRAERFGTGEGRAYTLTYSGRDAAGNQGTCEVQVTVPHDLDQP
jgi:YVTN family beta-propeller protein